MLSQGARDLLSALQVLCPGLSKDEYAIQIYHHERVCEWPQDIIHYPHKYFGELVKEKRHDQPLKEELFRF